ncbi:MAG: phosphate acyltransferase PlsX [Clostridia bacterium]|nr:phosphate acyltransferase PlsX [Clostridia bacterium]
MKIIIDAMGGDNAPGEIVKGVVDAASSLDPAIQYVLVGDEKTVTGCVKDAGGKKLLGDRITVVHADGVISMEDDPFDVVRKKKNSSMTVALKMLADGEGDAVVSAGNTGALYTGATMLVRCVKGIRRAAIAAIIPFERPMLLLDSGANVNVTAEYMEQFALMGAVYMEKLFDIRTPEVGLVNNGTESHKGTPVYVETFERLSANENINFVGNIEGKDIPKCKCDVLVADGFTGNIILKSIEGLGSYFMKRMKKMLYANLATKVSALVLKKELMQFKKDFDASEAGGSPFLGIRKPVIKAHGSSDARAIMNACRQAAKFAGNSVTEEIERRAQFLQKAKPAEIEGSSAGEDQGDEA